MTATGTVQSSTALLDVPAAMRRALELAHRGPAGGANPRVGCVLLDADGRLLSEGWHRGAGTPHAEADALSKLAPGAALGATAVVTLEPCNHTGRTGPCAEALIDAGVARVAFATADPNPLATGGGLRLREAGVAVDGPDHADVDVQLAALQLNETWFASIALGRPWVTAKWASSLDGRIAADDGTSKWITGPAARADVHRRRSEHGAILVGTGTAIADDPSLTARDDEGELLPHQPIPVVLGRRDVPTTAAVLRHPQPLMRDDGEDLTAVLGRLLAQGIRSVFLEGGPTIISAFAAANLVDEYVVYLAPTLLGGSHLATNALGVSTIGDQRRLTIRDVTRVGDDLVVVARPITARPNSHNRSES